MERSAAVEELAVWMNAFKHLAECFFPPEPALRVTITRLAAGLQLVCPDAAGCAKKMIEALDEEDPVQHQLDYAGLFVGPYKLLAPPYGSVYLEEQRQVMGESTMDVLRFYQSAGMDMAGDFNQPPDHIAAELEFMSFLFYRQIEAIQEGNREAYEKYSAQCRWFGENHLGRWCILFAQRMEQAAVTDFYKALARCLYRFSDSFSWFTHHDSNPKSERFTFDMTG